MKPSLFACNGQILARTSEGNDRLDLSAVNLGYVSKVFHARKTVGRNQDGELFYFRCPYRFNATQSTGERKTATAIKQRSKLHTHHPTTLTGRSSL